MKYKAFISYRHCQPDSAAAKKIIHIVETYGIPKTIIEKHHTDKRVGKLFRDEDELSAASNLSKAITDALDESEYLISIFSPEYVESQWCMLELNYWLEHKDRDKIIIVLLKGEPHEIFPPILTREGEPLAIDIRGSSEKEILKNINAQKLRIVAALISCDYDDLRQRDKEQARHNRMISAGVILGVLALFSAVIAILQTKANNELNAKNVQIENQNIELNDKNTQIEAQIAEINNKNEELENQNNEMKLLTANICSENAAFLAEKSLYSLAAKKLMEGIELCKDIGDSSMTDRLTYQLMDYINLYDPGRLLNKTGSVRLKGIFTPSFTVKGSSLLQNDSGTLRFFDMETAEPITTIQYDYSLLKNVDLINERKFYTITKEKDAPAVLTVTDLYDGSSCSYTFDDADISYFHDVRVIGDRIFVLSSYDCYEFDLSCSLLSLVTADFERTGSFSKEYILNTGDPIFINNDRMVIYDRAKREVLVDFQGENNNVYTNPSPYSDIQTPMKPVLYGDSLFFAAYDPEKDATGTALAQVSDSRIRGMAKYHTDNNYHSDSYPDENMYITTYENNISIVYGHQDINNARELKNTVSLSDSDRIKKAAISGNMAAVLSEEGTVVLYYLDGEKNQLATWFSGNYKDIHLTEDRLLLTLDYDISTSTSEVEIYSYKYLDNAEGYMYVYEKGNLSLADNLDNTICVKYHDNYEYYDWVYDAETCTLKYSRNEKDNSGVYYGGYAPFVANDTIIGEFPAKYSVPAYSSLTGEEGEVPAVIEWAEHFKESPYYSEESKYIYKYNDSDSIYFICYDSEGSHGEKYSLTDGSFEEAIGFCSGSITDKVGLYRIYKDVRAEQTQGNMLSIFKGESLTASYQLNTRDMSFIADDMIAFVESKDGTDTAVIYSLSQCKELFRSEAFDGSEHGSIITSADCGYAFLCSRYLVDLSTMTVMHDFGNTFTGLDITRFYYNEHLDLFGISDGSNMMYFDPETFEEMFTVENVYGATPDGKYIFVKEQSSSLSSNIIKLKMLTKEEILQKAAELYGTDAADSGEADKAE